MVALSVGRQASTTDTHHLSVLVMGKSQVLNTEQPWAQKPLFKMASGGAAQVLGGSGSAPLGENAAFKMGLVSG